MLWINKPQLWIALIATVFLMISHALSPWFSRRLPGDGSQFISFAGGVSVGYVFLDMLPNLVEYNKPIGSYLLAHNWLTAFTELLIYIVVLIGFLIYYGFDLFAERYQLVKHDNFLVYRLHLAMFCFYNLLITHTMALRVEGGMLYTILFTFAMALHFILTDRKFCRMYPQRFNNNGRIFLIVALFLGWLLSLIFDPINVLFVSLMTAFLAGSILFNVFREELPKSNLASFRWFVFGSLLIAIILLLQVYVLTVH
ncbi:MAG: hypothetical protein Q8R83_03215 [Legionellaceae bacterium]|nr:hypothetical protein [Legionellaceae bacterium]